MNEDEFGSLVTELGICSHTADAAISVLRRLLEVGELREDEDTDWIADQELDAALPWHPSRDVGLAWINSAGLIEHDEEGDANDYVLSERGAETLAYLREVDEAEEARRRETIN